MSIIDDGNDALPKYKILKQVANDLFVYPEIPVDHNKSSSLE